VKYWTRILLAGVGGQGVLSAGRWVGDAAFAAGLPVVAGQVHGLAQRGGSVSASVVIGGARSWEIPDGGADVLVALEPMEGARALAKVSDKTTVIVNTRPIVPISLQSANRPYPPLASLLDPLRERAGRFTRLDATALAEEAGSMRALNVVMLGLLAGTGLLPLPPEDLIGTIVDAGIPALAETNRHAFRLGLEAAEENGSGKARVQ
jgi:indolepyruvate ferredoxin oxidoreductase beta subunit